MENKFRSICELCTAISFTAFSISIVFYREDTSLYACMCSALIALFTLLANRISDIDMMKKGIGTGKNFVWAKVYRGISKVRLWIETIMAGIAILLVLTYFLTNSSKGIIFEQVAYYEAVICVGGFAVSEWLLFVISIILLGIEKIVFGHNTMNSLLQ